ncbi:MAG: rhodanese-like domain-containing protein [Candidatus Kapabacteria bacterium]|nr:rhodanese-like domain-containing protein [Candidatus Kapabacteria bacterium]
MHRLLLIAATMIVATLSTFAQVSNVSADEAKKLITSTKNIQVLDVRTPDEWKGGHLAMAKHINVNDADFAAKVAKLDTSKPVVVYCAAGGRSSRAAALMASKGFTTIYNVTNGGYTQLAATGLPTSTK